MSLRQLEAFCTVSMAGSVSDAARRLLPRALEVVERAGELPAVAAGVPGDAERLRVGASRTIGPCLMPALLGRFAASRPQAAVELTVANTAALPERLYGLELDLAFVEGDVPAPGFELDPWRPDALILLARAGHPLALRFGTGRRPLAGAACVRALAEARWAMREAGSGTRETFLRALSPAIGAPRIGVTVDDPPALLRRLAEGDWVGCASRLAASDELAAGRLVALRPPGAVAARALVRRFWIVRRPDRYRSAAVDALLALALGQRRRAPR